MSITIPAGFYTRPKAAKLFNRSQRSLERDLDIACLAEDMDVLHHYKLVTKDNELRDATDVTTEQVEKLVQEGMTPIWIVEGSYLEREFGRKGSPRPRRTAEIDDQLPDNSPHRQTAPDPQTRSPEPSPERAEQASIIPNDIELLKRYVTRLEDENQREKERHDRIVAKLFDQLDVKDKQISAWDEITQNIYKGLATGKLQPNFAADDASHKLLDAATSSPSTDTHKLVADAELLDERAAQADKSDTVTAVTNPRTKSPRQPAMSAKRAKKSAPPRKKKATNTDKPSAKHDGNTTAKKQTIWTTPISQLFTRRR